MTAVAVKKIYEQLVDLQQQAEVRRSWKALDFT
jgi:hypothetical protein